MIYPVAALLRAHGVEAQVRGDHVYVPAFRQRWEAEVVRELEHAIQLDVRIELWPGRWVVESVTGLGSGDVARNDALNAFAIGPFHVLLEAFRRGERETWRLGDRDVDVYVGACNVRGKPADSTVWFGAFRTFVEASDLPDGVHWIRVFHAQSDGKRVVLEILRDNEPWPEATAALAGAAWPTGDGYVSVRTFAVLRSGVDLTEVAARMLDLTDDAIAERFGATGRRGLALIPLAFGRVLLDKLGVEYSPTAIIDDREITLAGDAMFLVALAHARRVYDHDGAMFRKLALRSSELATVTQALNRGSQPEDLLLSPPVMKVA